MRTERRAELQQLTNLRQAEVLQQRKQHQAEFQRRQQQRLASAEHARYQDENSNPASAMMKSSDGAGVEAEAAESVDATGTESNINNQGNKRAAEESGGAQQPSASKKPRRNPRNRHTGNVKRDRSRAQKRNACEALSESGEREAGGGAAGKPDAV